MADETSEEFLARTKGVGAPEDVGTFLQRTKGVSVGPPQSNAGTEWTQDLLSGGDIPPPAAASNLNLPTGSEINAPIQRLDQRLIIALQPAPGGGAVDFYARKAAATGVHFLSSLAQIPGNVLTALTEQGPQIDPKTGRLVTPGLTINPDTGTVAAKPESALLTSLFAGGLRFGKGPVQLQSPNLLESRASLPLEGDILAPEAKTALSSPPAGPSVAVQPPTLSSAMPATAADAKAIASQYYKINAARGNRLLPGDFTNALIDDFKGAMPQDAMERAVAGEGRLEKIGSELEKLRDQPVTLETAQRTYSRIGDTATAEFKQNGPSETYRALTQIQTNMRDRIAPPDLAGNDPWTLARKAWSQAMKMQDLEAIVERANGTQNPATSLGTQINNLVNNPSRIRGYSPEEVAALKAVRDGGSVSDLLRIFGSRLIPIVAASVEGGTSGMLAGAGAGLVAHAGSSLMRRTATASANRRMNNALEVIAGGVPRDPTLPPPLMNSGNSLAAPLVPAVTNELEAQYR